MANFPFSLRKVVASKLQLVLVCLLLSSLAPPVHAQAKDSASASAAKKVTLPASNYRPAAGSPFFVLSDATYGSQDTAFVRFEAVDTSGLYDYGGVDIRLYRIPQPIEFLKSQKNLHRINVDAIHAGEGLSNTMTYLLDSWIKKSRIAWQGLFSAESRKTVTKTAPALATAQNYGGPSQFRQPQQFKPIKGLELLDQFRYPVLQAKSVEPPKDLKLDGSSSNFMRAAEGNIMIPLGRRAPGLYLAEAVVGGFRAVTLVFVSDTMAITKVASKQMLVWTAHRSSGVAVAGVNLSWTDGSGVLQSGATDARGLANFERDSPEQTWVFGQDPKGGVFISENFYYDSEIYSTKLYAVTDRPLYRPGDLVSVKMLGRQFTSSSASSALQAGEVELQIQDPNGMPIANQKLSLHPQDGADASFRLPENASVGGYEVRISYQNQVYLAAFRVAQYQKPHFEISLLQDKPHYKTGQPVKAKLQLTYPDGKPVKQADVQVSLRAQQLTMVEGELGYGGQFPLKLSNESYTSDGSGVVELELPAAKAPSRYIVTVFATDGAAYRVKLSKELLIERAANAYSLKAREQVSQAAEKVSFVMAPQGPSVSNAAKPVSWEALKLEDRSKQEGKVGGTQFDVNFAKSGSYMVTVKDSDGNVLAATSHWVSGDGMQALPGSVEIITNKEVFQPGETAQVLITFPEEVAQALLTLERDKVENMALLGTGDNWVKLQKLGTRQYRAQIPIQPGHGPNITFSVAYVKNGQYVFENYGLRVHIPKIDVQVKSNKEVYAPGEKVTLEVFASLGGKPVAANLALGVVDEMIYVLQPEIAPNIFDFFYHPRRNNVRTSASLSFVTYDLAASRSGEIVRRTQVNERAVKVLERPRRDEVDTALWQPTLKTDANGRASISFVMPDALTRWRITARAINADGVVGQKNAWLRSEKAFYLKWTSPDWMRKGDAPQASVALFNQGNTEQKLELVVSGAFEKTESVSLKPGINFVRLPMQAVQAQRPLQLALKQQGRVVDSFVTDFRLLPQQLQSQRAINVDLSNGEAALNLPPDANNLQIQMSNSAAAQFARVMDDLIDYPYGCVEQTSSRMIPLALALQVPGLQGSRQHGRLTQILHSQRLRLAHMAGPNAQFSWWGDSSKADPLLTTYAYYADWRAAQVLRLNLPSEHWQRLATLYASKEAQSLPILHKALMLWMMKEIGLPVEGIAGSLAAQLEAATGKAQDLGRDASLILADGESAEKLALAQAVMARVNPAMQVPAASWDILRRSQNPLAQAMLLLSRQASAEQSEAVLRNVSAQAATMDRAISLVWLHQALGGKVLERGSSAKPSAPWQEKLGVAGNSFYKWPSAQALPTSLKVDGAVRGTVAQIRYDSAEKEAHTLGMKLQRTLYRLEKQSSKADAKDEAGAGNQASGSTFNLVALKPGTVLKTDELYLDEIKLVPQAGLRARYLLVELPLPPGAAVEAGTWGINFQGEKEVQGLEKARHQISAAGYAVPFDDVSGQQVARHLLRFSQTGKYSLPAAQAYRMYQPEKKAFEAADRAWQNIEVQ